MICLDTCFGIWGCIALCLSFSFVTYGVLMPSRSVCISNFTQASDKILLICGIMFSLVCMARQVTYLWSQANVRENNDVVSSVSHIAIPLNSILVSRLYFKSMLDCRSQVTKILHTPLKSIDFNCWVLKMMHRKKDSELLII